MLRNPSLSKALAGASWGEYARQLQFKSEWAGRYLVVIDPFSRPEKAVATAAIPYQKWRLTFVEVESLVAILRNMSQSHFVQNICNSP